MLTSINRMNDYVKSFVSKWVHWAEYATEVQKFLSRDGCLRSTVYFILKLVFVCEILGLVFITFSGEEANFCFSRSTP